MNAEDRIAFESELLASGTDIRRIRAQDAERAAHNGIPKTAWTKAALRLSNMRRRLWSRID